MSSEIAPLVLACPACPGDETLAELLDGRLPGAARGRIEGHLKSCQACRSLVGGAGASSSASDHAGRLARGTQVGRYIVLELVGTGAMGTVYAAHDPELDRRVALKLLALARRRATSSARGCFARRRRWRGSSHPNVITVHDVGTYGDAGLRRDGARRRRDARATGSRERRATGANVLARLRRRRARARRRARGRARPPRLQAGQRAASATTAGCGSPTSGSRAACARPPDASADVTSLQGDALDATITRTGRSSGTPAYMAPEQFLGASADARADMFSFCVALYEALYGERPFAGTNILALRASAASGVLREAPLRANVPEGIRDVLVRGLRPRPEDRFPSMDALLGALEACGGGGAGAAGGSAESRPSVTLSPTATPVPAGAPSRAPRRRRADGRTSSVDALAEALLSIVGGARGEAVSRSRSRSRSWPLVLVALAAATVVAATVGASTGPRPAGQPIAERAPVVVAEPRVDAPVATAPGATLLTTLAPAASPERIASGPPLSDAPSLAPRRGRKVPPARRGAAVLAAVAPPAPVVAEGAAKSSGVLTSVRPDKTAEAPLAPRVANLDALLRSATEESRMSASRACPLPCLPAPESRVELPSHAQDRLRAFVEAGRRAWPSFRVDAKAFSAHIARLDAPMLERAPDLYLAFACSTALDEAIRALDPLLRDAVAATAGRVDSSPTSRRR